ncbi:MAG: HEAT repeat domain-containing protein [Planctomycetes bacterium]|nr:HEAT repeat domain-containing protein [Planctomycetota bacterium]
MKRVFVPLLFLVAACGGPREGAGDLVGVERLPEERRALLVAYGSGGDAWEAARAAALADPAATRFLVENLMLEMMRSYDAFAARTDPRAHAAFVRAEEELARLGAAAAPELVELGAVGDGIVADLATRTLVRIGRDALAPTVGALERPDPRVRRRMAELLGRLPHGGDGETEVREALRQRILGDDEWIVRAESARALGLRGARDTETRATRLVLERAIVDDDPAVRRSAAEGLAALGDPEAIPALANALSRAVSDGDVKLVTTVERSLSTLAGDRRSRTPQQWLDFWRERRSKRERR